MVVTGFLGGMIGAPELAIILVLVLILFGAGRLPQVLESFGKGIRAFRKASSEDPIDVTDSKGELADGAASTVDEAQEVERQPSAT
ncbi:MAG: twin-arginine translocase TatA/TatE family subunit [Myxococcales bacterium]|nr:twin-arginine translocase TatA/TatE family subunit [Myxococcales bacterium]